MLPREKLMIRPVQENAQTGDFVVELQEEQADCTCIGTLGVHSEFFYDPDGGFCEWCGESPKVHLVFEAAKNP